MEDFLRRIKLLVNFSLTLPINRHDFENKLSKLTIPNAGLMEGLSNSGKLFVGEISLSQLSLRPKKTFTQRNFIYHTRLNAKLNSTSNSVTIEGEIGLTKNFTRLTLTLFSFFFVITIPLITRANATAGLIVAFQLCFMLGVFYFLFRNTIKQSKNFFERELYFLTNNTN